MPGEGTEPASSKREIRGKRQQLQEEMVVYSVVQNAAACVRARSSWSAHEPHTCYIIIRPAVGIPSCNGGEEWRGPR